MLPAIHIDRPDACLDNKAAIHRAVARSTHSLQGAEARYWRAQEWNVLEQGYDLPDVYVCNIEVEALAAADIPIRCPRHDLYGFYVLEGGVHITAANRVSAVLRTKAMHYRLCYLPAAAYHCHFVRGMHRIFYFVAKDSVLLRQRSPELGEDIGPVEALRIKLSTPEVSPALPLVGRAYDAIQRFLHRPGTTYLRRYVTIHALVMDLLFDACDELRMRDAAGRVGSVFAKRMRRYIDDSVMDGEDVSAASVAWRFQVSYAYTKAVFKAHGGQPIGAYIRMRKLEQAHRMLEAGESPAQVARYICWTYGHFNKAFKARYGVSPRDYK